MPPRTRKNASSNSSTRANATTESQSGESSASRKTSDTKPTRGRKRKSTDSDAPEEPKRAKTEKPNDDKPEEIPEEQRKPRLTTPDLEFDFDHRQIRDPRPTPGRVKRPRYTKFDLPPGFKDRFYVPEPAKPKGRLNAFRKDEIFREQSLLDPSETFHHLYVCHRKGREGSPTYDEAGFQLDWKKVDDWMKPRAYNKRSMVNGMARALARQKREQAAMIEIFFVDGKIPEDLAAVDIMDYLKDHVSKDLGVPWHQIGVDQLVEWEKKGFPKQRAVGWWREPNKEERRRFMKMLSGGSLRKDL
ncbi:hypothetical protein M426DRAFT_259315 [Hypoxylon sp. CI-4A]|nr:hypothetical protein M426DRAFT_259315 [Hypoxylon sp. CI-4A]